MLPQRASSRKDPDSEREVFRSPGSMVLAWAWFVVAVIILVDLAVQGRDHAALVTAATVVAITGIVYSCAWRPRIVADSTGITIVNPVRDHHVPWLSVTNVDVVNAVRVHCARGPDGARSKILYSWAVQSSARSARKSALRREVRGQRPRLSSRSRMGPPPGQTPRYAELPEPTRQAMERNPADFTAARLAERAQHARQAAVVAGRLPVRDQAADEARPTADKARSAMDEARPMADGARSAVDEAGPAADGGRPPAGAARNGQVGADGQAAGGGQVTPGSEPDVDGPPVGDQPAVATAMPVTRWAWLSIAAMAVPVAVLVLVVLL